MPVLNLVVTKNISPAPAIMDRISRATEQEAQAIGREFVAEHKVRVSTWGSAPGFSAEASGDLDGRATNVLILVNGDSLQVKKWFWVDKGTAVRYAQLSRDWESKTAPGRRVPTEGRGRVLYIDRGVAWPGIEARRFSKDIVNELTPDAVDRFRRGVLRGLNDKGV